MHPMTAGVPTVAGTFRAEFREGKLAALHFPSSPHVGGASVRRPDRTEDADPSIGELRAQLAAYFRGRRRKFSFPLDLSAGTAFQRRVWRAMQRIPFGTTKSYGEIACEIGSPQGARAVGMACGKNPVPILVPCHRVVASGGKLGGFSAGRHWKNRLLALEGVRYGTNPEASHGRALTASHHA
jgi:methylated-DNA-[protein]-cysteine S-methyltransferase